jgi:hypothetical protein
MTSHFTGIFQFQHFLHNSLVASAPSFMYVSKKAANVGPYGLKTTIGIYTSISFRLTFGVPIPGGSLIIWNINRDQYSHDHPKAILKNATRFLDSSDSFFHFN